MPTIHFTADTHFHHQNILRYASRNFNNIQEMNEHLIQNWNRCVKPDDDIFHLGDFAFCKLNEFEKLISRLNGNIYIILGNHDKKLIYMNREYLLKNDKIKLIEYYHELSYESQTITLFHYGQRVWRWSYKGTISLYGHSHGRLPPHGRSMDVGVDSTVITSEYRPISIKEVLKFMDKQPFGLEADDIERQKRGSKHDIR